MGVLIIGVGNRYRRDDGVGPEVAQKLATRGWNAQEVDGDGATLMTLWEGAETVFLIDATRSGVTAGTIRRLEANTMPLPRDLGFFNSHAFGVAEAVETARALNRLPAHIVIYGIEGADFAMGEGLTTEVADAADDVIGRIAAELSAGVTACATP